MLTNIKYQPIVFESWLLPSERIGPAPIDFLADLNDYTQVQFKIERDARMPNAVCNASFASTDFWVGPSWDIADNMAEYDGTSSSLTQDLVFETEKWYLVTFALSGIQSGYVSLYNGGEEIGRFYSPSTHSVYLKAITSEIEFRPSTLLNEGAKISGVRAYKVADNYYAGLYDSSDNLDYTIPTLRYAKDRLNVVWSWQESGVSPNACYRLGIVSEFDTVRNSNGGFNSAGAWTLGVTGDGVLSIDSSHEVLDFSSATDGGGTATQTVVESGKTYRVVLCLKEATNASVQVTVGGDAGTARTEAGIYVEEFTSAGTDLVIAFEETAAGATASVAYIYVTEVGSLADGEPDFSQNLLYGDHSGSTILFNWANNTDAMGFVFDTGGFKMSVRVPGKIIQPTYPTEWKVNHQSDGSQAVRYGRWKKAFKVKTDWIPEQVMDALSQIVVMDGIAVQGQKVFANVSELEGNYDDVNDRSGQLTIECFTEHLYKYKTDRFADVDPTYPPICLATELDETISLEDETGCILTESQY